MPITLLTRRVRTRFIGTMRERLLEHRKRRREGENFSLAHKVACLCGRGNYKIDHCVNSYIAYKFSNTVEISKKRKGRRLYMS